MHPPSYSSSDPARRRAEWGAARPKCHGRRAPSPGSEDEENVKWVAQRGADLRQQTVAGGIVSWENNEGGARPKITGRQGRLMLQGADGSSCAGRPRQSVAAAKDAVQGIAYSPLVEATVHYVRTGGASA